ncbi:MAG: 2-C-methyl-D-erythritol 4-phosphate cytidylyltransferase [Castellaniella sp.]|uniref:IspD/TarI family cytidylyltransferase n=1 Tax=Castellaniella sp. TaxID=1955812 RepID=UPI002A36C7FC|nr:2-C-methyl-D-erythritol 4-phosphate cytidylyltransferase [Castellaniella sp.]MDY0308429.1 2-C-methyl-D-erythritol 4-phosphate cytidylyltransferase [Castellaniella sp.]
MNTESLIALVPAAGVGARAGIPDGRPKQYRDLGGEPMLRRTVRALLADPRILQVRVAVAAGDPWVESALAGLPRTVWRPCGGPTRAETVRAALQDAGLADDAWVLVHDAARPGLPADALGRLIDACHAHDQGGLLALPVADTVKQAGGAVDVPWVARTLPRDGLWLAQTPQMFRAGELRAALAACAGDPRVTDEASAVELAGVSGRAPLLVRGARANDKLTWPEDFAWFEGRLAARCEPPRP